MGCSGRAVVVARLVGTALLLSVADYVGGSARDKLDDADQCTH